MNEASIALAALVLGASASSGCAANPGEAPQTGAIATQAASADDAVLQVVFLHELRAAAPKSDEAVCLRVRTAPTNAFADPSDSLLAAIRTIYPTAVKASGCSGGGPEPVRVKSSGDPAVVSDIGPVVWDGADAAHLEGGGASRGGSTIIREVEYRLERDGSGWRIAGERVMRQT